jgi:hypothetical protein
MNKPNAEAEGKENFQVGSSKLAVVFGLGFARKCEA